jgi:hypothetical protein
MYNSDFPQGGDYMSCGLLRKSFYFGVIRIRSEGAKWLSTH